MEHLTWEIPAERRRSGLAQALDDLRFTLILAFHWLIGPFVPAIAPLTANARPGALPVIIVPGFICRPAIYRPLQQALHAAGHPSHILDLGFQVGDIAAKARQLSAYITQLGAAEVLVIGHSMGGSILATCLHQGETRIRRAWTLGTPLFGTNVVYGVYGLAAAVLLTHLSQGLGAYLLWAAVFFSPALRQMLPGSKLLAEVAPDYPRMTQVTSVFCAMDLIAFSNPLKEPGSSSRFNRPDDVLFPESGHNNIVMGQNAVLAITAAVAVDIVPVAGAISPAPSSPSP